jgi:hypothetical protein
MGRLLGLLVTLFVYLCVGTVLTGLILAGYALNKGYLNKEKITKIIAVAQGTDTASADATALSTDIAKPAETTEQTSIDEIENRRSVQSRDLELREQSLHSGLDQLRFEQRKMLDEKKTYDSLKTNFEKQLAELQTGAQATGRENIRLIWENIKPKQAKEQILQMIAAGEQADVVAIMSAMPIAKRAKIIGEFKTDEESKKLEELLRLIREGVPETKIINQARQQIKEFSNPARGLTNASNTKAEIANSNTSGRAVQ